MNVTGKELLDTLGIPVLYQVDMRLPTVQRTIGLFREHVALAVHKMAYGRKATEHTVDLNGEDIRTIIVWTEQYIDQTLILRTDNELSREIMPGVRDILDQLRNLLPEEAAV